MSLHCTSHRSFGSSVLAVALLAAAGCSERDAAGPAATRTSDAANATAPGPESPKPDATAAAATASDVTHPLAPLGVKVVAPSDWKLREVVPAKVWAVQKKVLRVNIQARTNPPTSLSEAAAGCKATVARQEVLATGGFLVSCRRDASAPATEELTVILPVAAGAVECSGGVVAGDPEFSTLTAICASMAPSP